jgi:large exoprotein involved in heme utilization and adhesion
LGTLGVTGGYANLFLINPNGIIFGPNARLDVGGSFLASTASSLNFADGTHFSATAPQTTPLLTVSVPIGLQFGTSAGSIRNGSRATNSSGRFAGLQVPPEKTLALLGGNVSLEGGNLVAPGSRVELGGVAGSGTVGLNIDGNNLHLSFPDTIARADVSLNNGAIVEGGRDIQLQGRRITLTDGSTIRATALGAEPGGNITITASDSLELSGTQDSYSFRFNSRLRAESGGTGGNITITTGRLIVRDGAEVSASNYGEGLGGNLTVTASNSVEVSGTSLLGSPWLGGAVSRGSRLQASKVIGSEGTGGNITITTGRLLIQDGAQVFAGGAGNGVSLTVTASDSVEMSRGTLSLLNVDGESGNLTIVTGKLIVHDGAQVRTTSALRGGKGGSLNVVAADSVELIGTSANSQSRSGLFSEGFSIGDAGNIRITTGRLLVQDGAGISASTFGSGSGGKLTIIASDLVELIGTSADGLLRSGLFTESTIAPGASPEKGVAIGNAGDLTIATGQLVVQDGAQVSASTFGAGKGGSLTVTASNSVKLIGTSTDGQLRSSLLATAAGTGNGGRLTIRTEQLNVQDRAQVSVSSQGTGGAGSIEVETNSIHLDNQGQLIAESTVGKGGNIQLVTDLLLLRRNSLISAVSGNDGSNGIDGNIDIETEFLVVVPKENSDIIATGYGRSVGSNIQVNAQSIFGTQFREQLTSNSDIVATETVELNTPDVDPNRGLTNLPTEVVDASNQIDHTCAARGVQADKNKFIVTGCRGMPSNPYESLSNDEALEDIHPPSEFSSPRNSKPIAARAVTLQPATSNLKPPIVEAQGWVINDKGQVVFTATASTVTPHNSLPASATCPSS